MGILERWDEHNQRKIEAIAAEDMDPEGRARKDRRGIITVGLSGAGVSLANVSRQIDGTGRPVFIVCSGLALLGLALWQFRRIDRETTHDSRLDGIFTSEKPSGRWRVAMLGMWLLTVAGMASISVLDDTDTDLPAILVPPAVLFFVLAILAVVGFVVGWHLAPGLSAAAYGLAVGLSVNDATQSPLYGCAAIVLFMTGLAVSLRCIRGVKDRKAVVRRGGSHVPSY